MVRKIVECLVNKILHKITKYHVRDCSKITFASSKSDFGILKVFILNFGSNKNNVGLGIIDFKRSKNFHLFR